MSHLRTYMFYIYVLPGDEIHDPNYASWRGIRMWCTLAQYREFVDLLRHGTHALCFYVQEKEEDKPRAGLKEYVRISAESEEMPGEQRDPYVFPRPSVESQDLVTFE